MPDFPSLTITDLDALAGRRCGFCNRPYPVSDAVAEESPFCAACLHERVTIRRLDEIEADARLSQRQKYNVKLNPPVALALIALAREALERRPEPAPPSPLVWGADGLFDEREPRARGCRSDNDGDCYWRECPQLKDGEPKRSRRHCPLDRLGLPDQGIAEFEQLERDGMNEKIERYCAATGEPKP